MRLIDIWRNVNERIGFYTNETSSDIPEKPGIYAWFIPLWIYKDNISDLIKLLNDILLYDANVRGIPETYLIAEFNWGEELHLNVKKTYTNEVTSEIQETWGKYLKNEEAKKALSQILMEASFFMPPLYVGKTKDLRQRYLQHVKGTTKDKNDFHTRFNEHLNRLNISIQISDLLFVCIETEPKSNQIIDANNLNTFVENILLRICRPIFSKR